MYVSSRYLIVKEQGAYIEEESIYRRGSPQFRAMFSFVTAGPALAAVDQIQCLRDRPTASYCPLLRAGLGHVDGRVSLTT
jgi:hypothetical protein